MVKDLREAPSAAAARQAIDEVLAAWNAAGEHWDPDAFAGVYAEDAVFFGGRPGQNNGRAGVRSYFASYLDMLASVRLHLQDHELFQLAPDVVLVQGYGCFDLVLADGTCTQSVLRGTLTLVRRQGRWQVLQHHFSEAPVVPPIGV